MYIFSYFDARVFVNAHARIHSCPGRNLQEEKKLCRSVVDSVMLKNGQDLVKLEHQLADCKRELSTAQSNGADAEGAATASRDERADILLALDNAKHETADGVAFIATLTCAQRRLEAEVEAAKAGWQAANYERDSCRQSCEAQVDSYKQQLQQSERQVQAVQSELEESVTIVMDRLVHTTKLQEIIDHLRSCPHSQK